MRFLNNALNKNIVVEHQTGNGKTLNLAILSMAISQDANKTVLAASMNPFKSKYGNQLFQWMRGVEIFSWEIKGNKII